MKFTFVHPQVKEEPHDDADDDEASWQHVFLWFLDLFLTVACRIITCYHVCMCDWDLYCCRTGHWTMRRRRTMASWSVYSSLRHNIVAHTTSLSGNDAIAADDEKIGKDEKDAEAEDDEDDEHTAGSYDAWLNSRFCSISATA